MEASLQLDQPRVIAFVERGNTLVYKFRRIVTQDWLRFFNGIVHEIETDAKGDQVTTFDLRTTLHMLVDDTLTGVEGYRTQGDVPLELATWKAKLPPGHKLKAGSLLKDVKVSDAATDELPILGETTDVSLECSWSSSDGRKMDVYSGLIHRFQPPSLTQMRRYNKSCARSTVVGGSRTGKTILHGSQPLLIELYDEMAVSVDGYSVASSQLGSDREAIKREMDAYHKVAAVENLFKIGGDEHKEESEEQ